jgi:hypothetical protein
MEPVPGDCSNSGSADEGQPPVSTEGFLCFVLPLPPTALFHFDWAISIGAYFSVLPPENVLLPSLLSLRFPFFSFFSFAIYSVHATLTLGHRANAQSTIRRHLMKAARAVAGAGQPGRKRSPRGRWRRWVIRKGKGWVKTGKAWPSPWLHPAKWALSV